MFRPSIFLRVVTVFLFTLFFSGCTEPNLLNEQLLINEFMVKNDSSSGVFDDEGSPLDWIEIYNPGDFTVFCQGYYISDSRENPFKYEIPAVYIAPKSFMLFWGGENEKFHNYLGFSFSTDKDKNEIILLSDSLGNQVDLIEYLTIIDDSIDSYGRNPDGSTLWRRQRNPSPGQNNRG